METDIKEESGLKFRFPEYSSVLKFDDTKFYRDYFNKLPEAKGVDFISVDKDKIAFIEVKNCTGGVAVHKTGFKKHILWQLSDKGC